MPLYNTQFGKFYAETENVAREWEQTQLNIQLQHSIANATQSRLDVFASTRGYDGIMSACTYATSTNVKFVAEGQYCVEARDATWATLYQILDEVLAGTRPIPNGYEDIEPELPALVWPVWPAT